MHTLIHEWVEQARAGRNANVVARLKSGWVVAGERQNLPGYFLLLPDPVVPDLNDLDAEARRQFLSDMVLLGDAVMRAFRPARLNYEILGNTAPALHAHVFARYAWEPKVLRTKPVWFYYPWWMLKGTSDPAAIADTVAKVKSTLAEIA